jgi:hypothetical protein
MVWVPKRLRRSHCDFLRAATMKRVALQNKTLWSDQKVAAGSDLLLAA